MSKESTNAKQFVSELIKIVKETGIDEKYLNSKGIYFEDGKSTQCPIHNGEGKNFKYLHTEEGTIYKCFSHGCVSGDIIELCMKLEGFSSPYEAVKYLASNFNIDLPINKTQKRREFTSEEKKAYAIQKQKEEYLQSDEYLTIKSMYLDELNNLKNIKISDENIPLQEIDFISKSIKDIESNRAEVPLQDFKRLQLLYDYKKHEKKSNIFEVNKYISEYQELVEAIMLQEGLFLVNCFTGGGKTYSTLNAFKNLSKKYDDYVFVIACPNRVQNLQNGYTDGVFALVGGVTIQEYNRVVSSVYEKINEVIDTFHDKKIVLIIDEAHQLLDSISYRRSSIEKLEEVSAKCRTVIHLTATDRKLLEYDKYQYDAVYKFLPNSNNNINLDNFNLIKCENAIATMLRLAKINKINNKKSLAFISGEKENFDFYKKLLEEKGLKVGVVTSDHKGEEIFTSISEKSLIPEGYDIILASSVLDCGTNLKNEEEIISIDVVTDIKYFNLDTIEQRFARIRTKQKQAILLIPESENISTDKIKSLDKIKSEWNYKINKTLEYTKGLSDFLISKNTEPEHIETTIREILKTNTVFDGYGVVELVEGVPVINHKKLLNRIFQDYDRQLLGNTDLLLEVLKTKVKANTFTEGFEINEEEDHQQVEQFKEDKKQVKKAKEEYGLAARELILKARKNQYLKDCLVEYISSDNKSEIIQSFYDAGEEQVYKDLKFLEGEVKELKKLKTLLKIEELSVDLDLALEVYEKYDKQAHIDRFVKSYMYAKANKQIQDDEMKLEFNSVYGTIRNTLDPLLAKRSRISKEKIDELIENLNKNKCIHRLLDSELNKKFKKTYGTDSFKDIKDKVIEDIFKEVNMIYKLSADKEAFRVSSLIKKIDL